MDTQQKNTKKSKRARSPDYPQYTLEECIKFLDMFVKANGGFTEAHMDVAVESMGHSITSSTAARVVASMLHYGLFDARGSGKDRFFRPSELAGEIYKASEQSSARFEGLQEAALNPTAMQTVWEKWGSKIPSKKSLEKSLLVELGFSKLGAERFSIVVTENYQYARLEENGKIEPELETTPEQKERFKGKVDMPQNGMDVGERQREKPVDIPKGLSDYRIPISRGRDFHFAFPPDITESEIEFVVEDIKRFMIRLIVNK